MRAYGAKTEFFKDKYKLPAIKKVKNLSKYTKIRYGEKAKNWIATKEGRASSPYFRLFLDHIWVLPDIERVQ